MKKVPTYMEKIVIELNGKNTSGVYSVDWLNKWVDGNALLERYGKEWKCRNEVFMNHQRALGFMAAVMALYYNRVEKLPKITLDAAEVLSLEVSEKVNQTIEQVILAHFATHEKHCNNQ